MQNIVSVVLPIALNLSFDYLATDDEFARITVGKRVAVPFGHANKRGVGIALKLKQATLPDQSSLKSISSVLEGGELSSLDLKFYHFIARYYGSPLGAVIKAALPKGIRQANDVSPKTQTLYQLTTTASALDLPKQAKKQRDLLNFLEQNTHQNISANTLLEQGFQKSIIKTLLNKGLLQTIEQPLYALNTTINTAHKHKLNHEQAAAVKHVLSDIKHFSPHVIYGVTGSGKTEVYLQLIETVLKQGKQTLVLVPEIALTPQMIKRFENRFPNQVAAVHSGLAENTRKDLFLQVSQGHLPILIGTRSAIFMPFKQLGLLIVDEEHDSSYKQQEGLRYHARDLAIVLAKQRDIPVVLGSATPSLETVHNCQRKNYTLTQLTKRAATEKPLMIQLINAKSEALVSQGLTQSMVNMIRQALHEKQQVAVFLNRRGFAKALHCDSCGWQSKCPNCSVNQVAYLKKNYLLCHYCGTQKRLLVHCPDCKKELNFKGLGTEKLESILMQQFPKANILRLDRDAVSTYRALNDALKRIENKSVDIIIGTQLLVKGHDFPNLGLVCAIDVDSAFYSEDFRAEEHTFQQLIQLAGRAGRHTHMSGKFVIQTSMPEHPVFQALIQQDYLSYAKTMLTDREQFQLPPKTSRLAICANALNEAVLFEFLTDLKLKLANLLNISQEIQLHTEHSNPFLFGPVPDPITMRNKRYYARILLHASDKKTIQSLIPSMLQVTDAAAKSKKQHHIAINFDVDPI